MKIRRTAQAASVVVVGSLVLAACTSSPDDPATADGGGEQTSESGGSDTYEGTDKEALDITETAEGEIFYSTGQDEWTGYNTLTADTYSTYGNVIMDRIRPEGFFYFGTDGTIHENPEFGTVEVVSGLEGDDPLVIEYTVNDDATWSDGNAIDYGDFLLEWVSQNPAWLSPDPAAPVFNHVSGPDYPNTQVPDGPQGEDGDKTFTVEYAEKYPDWKLVTGAYLLPAHVVADQIGLTETELVQAIKDQNVEVLTQAAEFWNDGWLSNPGELPDPSIAPSGNRYQLMEGGWTAGQSLTLEANPEYWGTPAATDRITFRFLAADAHTQALENGDLNVIEPQATVDTLPQLEQLGDAVEVQTGAELTWEHLDFNFASGVFSDAEGGLALREAFAYCMPRQQIVDNLIAPVDPEAQLMNAREVFPFQDTYDEVVEASYDGRFDEVNLEEAQRLVEESGIATPIDVRIGYSAPNPRRTNQVEMIKSSCDQVGFNVTDVGSADFFSVALPAGDYEAALFAWAGSGQIASGQNIYSTAYPQNYGGYTNTAVDEAWVTLAQSLDPEVHLEQTKVIERELWDTLFGIPIFAHPGVVAYSAGMENVRHTATQNGVAWNADQWLLAE
ncbi:ABC transporter substrate-binding protein [Georgenia faecalis]|uniref:ABC transporter substrate-binding protein n=1 Tax=Georgenia faecalis TaxID=2483799 RepID=A0ABV9D6N3_9MICO|nr:ABC transporter substrate-binding protein [Georgenia faecalis]